jgi:hypothetical protein
MLISPYKKIGPISTLILSGAVVTLGACSSNTGLAYSGASFPPQYEVEHSHERGPAEAPDAAIASEVCRTDVNRRSNEYGQVTEQPPEACEDDDGKSWRETGQDHQADEPDVSMPDQPLQEVEPE